MATKDDKKKNKPRTPAASRKLFTMQDPTIRLTQDLRENAKRMGIQEARYLIDSYYQYQNVRIRANHQRLRCNDQGEPSDLLDWAHGNFDLIESDVKSSLRIFAEEYAVGQWLQGITGIADVLSAAFLTTFDIRERLLIDCNCTDKAQDKKHGKQKRRMRPYGGDFENGILRFRCTGRRGHGEKEEDDGNGPETKDRSCKVVHEVNANDLRAGEGVLIRPKTAGHFWNYAGLNPDISWEKGQLRPWNDRAKVLCFKAGESWVKTQNRESDFYGHLFAERKAKEVAKNEAGEFAKYAAVCLSKLKKERSRAKSFYEKGKLPPAHIHARARRWVVKLFLSHLHDVMYRDYYGEAPPVPFAFSKHCEGEHSHYIAPPEVETDGKSLRHLYGEV